MTALKVLELIDDEGRPTEELEALVLSEGDARRQVLRKVLERFYEPVFKLDLERATRAQFREAFRSFGTREGVLTKCEAFFIRAAQDAGIELSQYILARRHGTRRSTAAAGRPRPTQRQQQPEPAARTGPAASTANGPSVRLELAERILAKYPDFDPSWASEVQARWMEGMTKLYESLATQDPDPAAAPQAGQSNGRDASNQSDV